MNTEKARDRAMARMRRGRMEDDMTGRIRKAWAQLDVAVDECARLAETAKRAERDGDLTLAESFQRDLALEQAKARGKAEILALIMPAPLDTPEAISREAGLRFAAKQRGEERETPGLRMVGRTIMDDVEGRPAFT